MINVKADRYRRKLHARARTRANLYKKKFICKHILEHTISFFERNKKQSKKTLSMAGSITYNETCKRALPIITVIHVNCESRKEKKKTQYK